MADTSNLPPFAMADEQPMRTFLRSQPQFLRELLAGGVAGGLAKSFVAPLERTKILLQTGRTRSMGIGGTLGYIWQREGLMGMFRGNGASVIRIVPYAAIHFAAYEHYHRLLVDHLYPSTSTSSSSPSPPFLSTVASGESKNLLSKVSPLWDLIAGSMAGVTAVVLTYPLDVVRTRLAWATDFTPSSTPSTSTSSLPSPSIGKTAASPSAPHPHPHPHPSAPSIRSELTRTFKQGGVVGLYRGVTPTLLGILPYAGLKFYFYNSLKVAYNQQGGSNRDEKAKLPTVMMLLFGGVSGLMAQSVTYPLDVVRRRMQVGGMVGAGAGAGAQSVTQGASSSIGDGLQRPSAAVVHTSTWKVMKAIVTEEGMKGLFRGVSLNFIKVVPTTAIGFTAYDSLKSYLGVQKGHGL